MKFIKYRSIENSYRNEFINQIIDQGLSDGEWVVQEKVHGANFSFWMNKEDIRVANRSEFLGDDGPSFYSGYKIMVQEHLEKVKRLFDIAKGEEVRIFGELFGGTYSHPDVSKVSSATRIQKGIHYAPFNGFYAFDVVVDGQYLSVDDASSLFLRSGMFHAKALFRGTFEECLKHPNCFQSHIPEWLGLPGIEENSCEGIVIRPVIPKYLKNTSEITGRRVIIKNKNEMWEERERSKKKTRTVVALTEQGQTLFDELCRFVTSNRLDNVISKIGSVGPKELGKLVGLFNKDVLDDFHKDFGKAYGALEKSEQKRIRKLLGVKTMAVVKNYFLEFGEQCLR